MTRLTALNLRVGLAALTISSCVGFAAPALAEGTVNVYSYRQPDLIKPVLDAFTEKTGIETEVLFLDKGLEERIAAEGENSPADVILTVDISRLTRAKEKGVTQPLDDADINAALPAEYRDPEGHWFGVTRRGRVVYASKDRVSEDEMSYADLADPKWEGKICIRSGQHDYNLALFSALIAHWGEEKTEEWMKGFKTNLARKPSGNDRAGAKAIYSGECDLALGNTYYVGLMMTNEKEPEQKDWAGSVKVIFPSIDDAGTHVNISGMALAKHAPNKDNAVKLMEFLASDEAQHVYAAEVFEYPVKDGVEASDIVKSFGELNADTLPLAEIASHRKAASEMVDRVGLDDGPAS
ncbi:Fe(3+) ABC transporter substrate-binding protein [Mesorhizobium xinjiangense]|uniref:Fe(3+) ABC transporter substrate-binding protein n=1 Tax=Mesorhizobium xinjiangense TaxID=2678685 RepID=UPI0012EE4DE3|nr:Fe(3+) ABC transporter substrate-binding protein [Mesorhizobium xinjiangense]